MARKKERGGTLSRIFGLVRTWFPLLLIACVLALLVSSIVRVDSRWEKTGEIPLAGTGRDVRFPPGTGDVECLLKNGDGSIRLETFRAWGIRIVETDGAVPALVTESRVAENVPWYSSKHDGAVLGTRRILVVPPGTSGKAMSDIVTD